MIRAIYNEREYSLKVSGHAGYAQAGADIVCAGVSGICDALIGAASSESKRLLPAIYHNRERGELRIELYPEKERDRLRAKTMLEMAYIGFEKIESRHGEYIECQRAEEE